MEKSMAELEREIKGLRTGLILLQSRCKELENNTHDKNKFKNLSKVLKKRNHVGNSEKLSDVELKTIFNSLIQQDQINILLDLV